MVKGKKKFAFFRNLRYKVFRNLRYKYRLVVINDDTFEQRASVRLSKFNLYLGIGGLILLVMLFVSSLIAFTNLKYYLPGVGTTNFRNEIKSMSYETDSLAKELSQRNLWIDNFQKIISGNLDSTYFAKNDSSFAKINIDSIDLTYLSESDLALRKEVENSAVDENLTLKLLEYKEESGSNLLFPSITMKLDLSPPLKGVVVKEFSLVNEHFGVDIAGKAEEPIKAIYKGVVILSEWNPKTGYVIAIQHPNNMISFYKHNSFLLKKIGTFVNKGEAIAVIGSSGEYSSGPHLHLEIWQNGKPQNPMNFIELNKLK